MPTEMRKPSAELRLPDATELTLFRAVEVTKDNKAKIVGDWMIALEAGHRVVLFFYERDPKQVVETIYDTHTMTHGEHSDVPLPEKLDYVFYDVDDKREEEKYLRWYGAFPESDHARGAEE